MEGNFLHSDQKTKSSYSKNLSSSSGGGGPSHVPQSFQNNPKSIAIRREIHRFESIHPSIYAIYDLTELVPDPLLAQQIRENVVCIEESFVSSQEWTLSRNVSDIRLGIVGSLTSGKSALVHRYLTGTFVQDESPEGGRFKKEIVVGDQSFLLLIRDEGGSPEHQFTTWVDAVVFVFSLENELSFNAIQNYFSKMCQYRNMKEIPLILVGTQDAVNENNLQVIDETKARKLARDLNISSYYETCATYGLNVERVFQDACQKVCQGSTALRPSTSYRRVYAPNYSYPYGTLINTNRNSGKPSGVPSKFNQRQQVHRENFPPSRLYKSRGNHSQRSIHPLQFEEFPVTARAISFSSPTIGSANLSSPRSPAGSTVSFGSNSEVKFIVPSCDDKTIAVRTASVSKEDKDGPTPNITPTSSRKNRRKSNIFTPSKKSEDSNCNKGSPHQEVGSGRSIPIRQGVLFMKSNKSFGKEWKKKYVTLCNNGMMTYHPSINDYMNNIHGKEISLQFVTVKVPGKKPRGLKSVPQAFQIPTNEAKGQTLSSINIEKAVQVIPHGSEVCKNPAGSEENNNGFKSVTKTNEPATPFAKKRHQKDKMKALEAGAQSPGKGCCTNESQCFGGGFEFHIISLDNKQWFFEVSSMEERDEWVSAIEQQILKSLQGNESSKGKKSSMDMVDLKAMKSLRSSIQGNTKCAECNSQNPNWASINLGILMCIECSGVHRKLGSHISRVRSLDLDEWPPGHLAVMRSLGNEIANSIWEATLHSSCTFRKPMPNSSQGEKERFIIAKYHQRNFLEPLPQGIDMVSFLVDGIFRCDMRQVALGLAHATQQEVNGITKAGTGSTPLHLASLVGDLAMVQMLLWSNANAMAIDYEGRSCIAFVRPSSNISKTELIELLLSHGCPRDAISSESQYRRRGAITKRPDMFSETVMSSIV